LTALARYVFCALAIFAIAACAAKPKPPPIAVVKVVSAHHGVCAQAARRRYGESVARLFSVPLPYRVYHCMTFTEAALLRGGCGTNDRVVFITFAHAQEVRFVQGTQSFGAHIRTLGAKWEKQEQREILLIDPQAFPHPPPPPGEHIRAYHGPEKFGLFGVDGDPLGLADGEC
jgi:hypothetical protein